MGRFKDKTVVVTGAAGRLGSAVARQLCLEGANVVLADTQLAACETLAQALQGIGGRVLPVQVDITDAAQVERMYAAALELNGRIDVVHNNAALIGNGPDGLHTLGELDLAMWERTMQVNITGAMLVIRLVLKQMVEQGGGVIVNTTSISSLLGEDVRSAYSASKAALNAMTRHVATAYGRHGVRCNAVAPGLMRADPNASDATAWKRHNALPYVGTFDDVAKVVAFLASDDSRYVTGQVLVADGGFSAHFPSWADGGHASAVPFPAPTR